MIEQKKRTLQRTIKVEAERRKEKNCAVMMRGVEERKRHWSRNLLSIPPFDVPITSQIAFSFGFSFSKTKKPHFPFNFYGFLPFVFVRSGKFNKNKQNKSKLLRLIKCLIIIRNNRKTVGEAKKARCRIWPK